MDLFKTIEQLIADGVNVESRSAELWQQFGRHYAVVVIDSSGFTRTVKERGTVYYLERLVRMRSIALPVLEKSPSVSYRFEADNVFAYFEHVDDAVQTVLDIHQAIRKAKLFLADDEPYHICAGVGYGDMLFLDFAEGCFGDEMNQASKLGEDIAEPDELLLTDEAFNACSLALKDKMQASQQPISGTLLNYYHLDMLAA